MSKMIPDVPSEGLSHDDIRREASSASSTFYSESKKGSKVTSGGDPVFENRSSKNSSANVRQPARTGGTGNGHGYEDNPFPEEKV